MTPSHAELDRIDLRILKILQDDGRLSNLKLAEQVLLSPAAVLARVQRLTREGYILGYEARLNPLKLGAGLLVFVDVMKELPATLVMRPFNFDTLATQTYNLASDERLAEASSAALAIVVVGLLPLILLSRQIARGRKV